MESACLQTLYEDEQIIVCYKPPQIATQSSKIGQPDMVSLLKNHLFQNRSQHSGAREPYLAVIHRLDQPVRGILVFAKTPFAAKELNRQLTHGGFGKYYRALVDGIPPTPEGTLENYLLKDGRTNMSHVCEKDTPDAKLAKLHYTTVETGQEFFQKEVNLSTSAPSQCELEIHLDTGRHHQIRVQLAAIGCPIIGDAKYNPHTSEQKYRTGLCLCAYKLEFRHPKTKNLLRFSLERNDK